MTTRRNLTTLDQDSPRVYRGTINGHLLGLQQRHNSGTHHATWTLHEPGGFLRHFPRDYELWPSVGPSGPPPAGGADAAPDAVATDGDDALRSPFVLHQRDVEHSDVAQHRAPILQQRRQRLETSAIFPAPVDAAGTARGIPLHAPSPRPSRYKRATGGLFPG